MESWRATIGAMKSVNTVPLNPIWAFGCFYTQSTVGADDNTADILKVWLQVCLEGHALLMQEPTDRHSSAYQQWSQSWSPAV